MVMTVNAKDGYMRAVAATKGWGKSMASCTFTKFAGSLAISATDCCGSENARNACAIPCADRWTA